MRALLLLLLVGACGDDLLPDGAPLTASADVTVVAHQDDDLLFMQPDLLEIASARSGLTNVYVTAGNGNSGVDKADRRYRGLMEAYAEAADLESAWACGWIDIAGHVAQHCRLDEAAVSLVFLGYPDGGKEGELAHSLLRLWTGEIESADTVADRSTRYDQAELIATVAEIIQRTRPTTIRTLDLGATHGRDHSDHQIAGALAMLGAAQAGFTGELLAFRGYETAAEPETLIAPLYEFSASILAHYTACVSDCGRHTCGSACSTIPPEHEAWLRRRYAIGMRRDVRGVLRSDGACVRADARVSTSCTASDAIELSRDGQLRVGGRCLAALPSGEVLVDASCQASAASRWFLDEDGRLWNGAPPPPEGVRPYAHLSCLVVAGDRLRVQPCGEPTAPRWQLANDAVAIARPSWLPSAGRAVRGWNDSIHAVVGGEVWSATWSGAGFTDPVHHGALAVEPESLVVALLDGHPRACGRDDEGITCRALDALPSADVERWTATFARAGTTSPADRSLAAVDNMICGLGAEGVMCAPRGLAALPEVRSRWPSVDGVLWAGDLDGDQRPDWCTATPTGAACGRDDNRWITSDGVPWSYAFGGVVEPAPVSTSLGALHDIDSDGRADLCQLRDGHVWCARSQRVGFGPQISLAVFPQAAPTGLWFVADRACVDDGVTLACAPLP
ncbi:MAG: PIG-L family deacetylase [Kofleriaceae bacterium]|nr:PIG-L family deacetylase [Kofleriaceae bacterium]